MKRLLILCLILLAGCGVAVQPDGSINIPITLSESDVNNLLEQAVINATSNGQALQTENLNVDLQPGQLVLTGDFGNPPQPGSITVQIAVDGDQISAAITSVDIPGVDPNDSRIQDINTQISQALGGRAAEGQAEGVRIVAASVSEDALTLTINVRQTAATPQ